MWACCVTNGLGGCVCDRASERVFGLEVFQRLVEECDGGHLRVAVVDSPTVMFFDWEPVELPRVFVGKRDPGLVVGADTGAPAPAKAAGSEEAAE